WMFIRFLPEGSEASQPQLPRSGPDGQPIESSQLEQFPIQLARSMALGHTVFARKHAVIPDKRRSRADPGSIPDENLASCAVALTAGDLREISEGTARISLKGERLPEAALKMTGR
ncbi:hypothetical protein J2Y55_003303, partial [Bosea sp. BE125]|nr:hypothetical protein [Bosea sp. BE125]